MTIKKALRGAMIAAYWSAPLLMLMLAWQGHLLGGLAVGIGIHALWLASTLWPACGWYGEVVCTLPPAAEKQVWLTIDDGPDEEDTPLLLSMLADYGVKATFFFIGEKAARHPELVREVIAQGHTVGNHTMTHPQYSFWACGPWKAKAEIHACQETISRAAGVSPQWFRAPAGFKNPFVQSVVARLGLRLACWSARGLDGVDADPVRVLERLKASIRPGGIILMHEARTDAQGQRLAPQVLGELLPWLKAQGYTCVLPPS